MTEISRQLVRFVVPAFMLVAFAVAIPDISGQTTRRRRTSTPIPAPTATPFTSEPLIISRADEFPDENSPQAIPPDPNETRTLVAADAANLRALEELGNRIKNLEASGRKVDPDEKNKRLLLNLDILTRAEQRSESLRKQVFEMIEKESVIKTKLDSLAYDLRPEAIERSVALVGTLRPEEIRESRKKSLESERANLQSLLTEIQKTKVSLDISLQRADSLVERLRVRLERDIDTALDDDPDKEKQN